MLGARRLAWLVGAVEQAAASADLAAAAQSLREVEREHPATCGALRDTL